MSRCSYCGKPLGQDFIPVQGMKFHYPDCYKKWKEEKKNKAETIDEEVLEKLESVLSGVGELSKLLKLRKKS